MLSLRLAEGRREGLGAEETGSDKELGMKWEVDLKNVEFVALANNLKSRLVTADKKITSEFPNSAVTIESILDQR